MHAALVTPRTDYEFARPALTAWGAAITLAFVLAAAGVSASEPLPTFGWAAAFLALAVAADVRAHRIPNLLTLPALILALALSPVLGATPGWTQAFAGAGLGFVLLLAPYALGGMGAGDVKALMVVGAWLGPQALLASTAWALIVGALLAAGWLAVRGEISTYARRWGRNLAISLSARRLHYEAPPLTSAAARGLPFAVPLAAGVALHWTWGLPW